MGSKYLRGQRILPGRIGKGLTVTKLIDDHFQAFNAARVKEAAQIFTGKMLEGDTLVGLSLSGALTPAGLGRSCIVPLIERGFVDWIISTGANLYHDVHFGLGMELHRGSPAADDRTLKEEGVVRIYDVLFDHRVLLDTDRFIMKVVAGPEFNTKMGTARFHNLLGKYLSEMEKTGGRKGHSLLAAAYRAGVPVFTPSPGDSSIGMNVAFLNLAGGGPEIDVSADVNESAAIVYDAKKSGGKSAVLIFGGGAPKNFLLQTEPHIQEVLGLKEYGHDYFIQVTDARPDTGGLSGATPSEAVSWGKVDPGSLPDTVVCYVDSTIALPLLTAYAMSMKGARRKKRIFSRLDEMVSSLKGDLEGRNST